MIVTSTRQNGPIRRVLSVWFLTPCTCVMVLASAAPEQQLMRPSPSPSSSAARL
eukprot:CAMPEP_0181519608 /NCGR_PEP_ID=MMETSP1110-20121109/65874_1 /TAXON_ID=174948 /ORGANISM="Symbiodinium sp., Strain CCMP421" /LENGTH=53 /DNA_ID=CAMNT_0023650055 /DNA_START=387 /DNA_END=548 /DNA_ORIENTATION=+